MSFNGKTSSRATGSRLAGTRITGKLGKCGRGTRKTEEGEGKKKFKQRLIKRQSSQDETKVDQAEGGEIRRGNSGSAARTATGELGCEGERAI